MTTDGLGLIKTKIEQLLNLGDRRSVELIVADLENDIQQNQAAAKKTKSTGDSSDVGSWSIGDPVAQQKKPLGQTGR